MKQIGILFIFLFTFNQIFGSHLENVPISLKQPDGNIITCYVTGDEFHKRVHDKYNFTIVRNRETGYYVYALKDGNEVVASDYIVGQINPRLLPISPNIDVVEEESAETSEENLRTADTKDDNFYTKGELNNIVISIRFADQEPTQLDLDKYDSLFYSETELSLVSYVKELSNSQLYVNSVFFPVPEDKVVLEYQDDHNRDYYLRYDEISNPNGYKSTEYSVRERDLITKALKSVENQILDLGLNLDKNNDNVIDNLTFIIQGDVDGWGNLLWPMSNTYFNAIATLGNLQVKRFVKLLSNNLQTSTICEEFTHSIGFPDFYRYADNRISPVGNWILSQGNLTYAKWKYGKWFDAIPELSEVGTYSLKSTSSEPFACYKIPSPNSIDEFFMLEYRKKEGIINSELPASYDEGLLIYRVNSNVTGNAGGPPDEVYIYRPNGTLSNNGKISEAAFSANNNRTSFDDLTNPSCFLSDGTLGGIKIADISMIGDQITFTVSNPSALNPPRNLTYDLVNNKLTLYWNAPKTPDQQNVLIGYNIYRLGEEEPLNSNTVADSTLVLELNEYGQLLYKVTAVYNTGESLPVSIIVNYNPDEFVDPKDSTALVALYNSCNGDNWLKSDNWLETQVAYWHGVELENGRVKKLNLTDNNLVGELPLEIRFLTGLENLVLDINKIRGKIPDEIGSLTNLWELFVQGNELEGSLPSSLFELKNLERLALNGNNLSGNIPKEVSDLVNLELLGISGNDFEGEIPKEIAKLKKLWSLDLSQNKLSGKIPYELGNLKSLIQLDLAYNQLNGNMPKSLWELKTLKELKLQGNQLTGAISPEIQNLHNLYTLLLSFNQLSSEIPLELWTLESLEHILLANNNLTCSDANLTLSLPFLETIELMGNNMKGSNIFQELCKQKSIQRINLVECQLGGEIPKEIGNLSLLQSLQLAKNDLYGQIPVELGNLQDLNILTLWGNRFYFKDIEPLYNLIDFEDFVYQNQRIELEVDNYEIDIGDSVTLNFDNYLIGENDKFILFRSGVGEIQSSYKSPIIYKIDSEDDWGMFFLKVYNELLEDRISSDAFTIKKPINDANEILDFKIEGQLCETTIDKTSNEVLISVNGESDLRNLYTEFILSNGASTNIQNKTHFDYSEPLIIVVTAKDGVTQKNWQIIVEKNEIISSSQDISICEGESFNGWFEAGTYIDTLSTIDGCDSLAITNLLVNPIFEIVKTVSICKGESYKGWTATGRYFESFSAINGCDSLIIIDLSVMPSVDISETVSICEGKSYKGWTGTGIYIDSLTTMYGCDSLITTHLTINTLPTPDLTYSAGILASLNTYSSYQWYNQDGKIEGATEKQYVVEIDGFYYLEVTDENGCSAMTSEKDFISTGISEFSDDQTVFQIVPNPNIGKFKLRFRNGKTGAYQIQFNDVAGQVQFGQTIHAVGGSFDKEIDLSFIPKGTYIVKLFDGERIFVEKIISH